jgi:group I intron endonuclease
MKEIKSGIYCIENKKNHKKYIGWSTAIHLRWKKHKSELKMNTHHNNYLQNAWNKKGEKNFKFFVIEEYPPNDEVE